RQLRTSSLPWLGESCYCSSYRKSYTYNARCQECGCKQRKADTRQSYEPHIQPAWLDSTVSPQPRRRARTRVCCAGRSTASISRYVFRDQKFSPSANRKTGSNGFLNSQYNTIAWTSRNGIRKHIPAITTKKNHPQGA